jgi:hypothetical protein
VELFMMECLKAFHMMAEWLAAQLSMVVQWAECPWAECPWAALLMAAWLWAESSMAACQWVAELLLMAAQWAALLAVEWLVAVDVADKAFVTKHAQSTKARCQHRCELLHVLVCVAKLAHVTTQSTFKFQYSKLRTTLR